MQQGKLAELAKKYKITVECPTAQYIFSDVSSSREYILHFGRRKYKGQIQLSKRSQLPSAAELIYVHFLTIETLHVHNLEKLQLFLGVHFSKFEEAYKIDRESEKQKV